MTKASLELRQTLVGLCVGVQDLKILEADILLGLVK
jgi:hypothetical protein